MDTSLTLEVENFEYYLVFTFDEPLDEIDFEENLIDSLIYVYISDID